MQHAIVPQNLRSTGHWTELCYARTNNQKIIIIIYPRMAKKTSHKVSTSEAKRLVLIQVTETKSLFV